MPRRIFTFTNGIDTFPGDSKNWNGRAVTYTHLNTESRAEKIEYFCGPIGRAFGQKERCAKLLKTSQYYSGWQQTHVGHSNGAAVILGMLQDYRSWPDVEHLHLVNAAAEADFNKNGLNRLLAAGRIGNVIVYVGGEDKALRIARCVGHWLGYGTLGLHGPWNILPSVKSKVRVVDGGPWLHYGHSDCWNDYNFAHTMNTILG